MLNDIESILVEELGLLITVKIRVLTGYEDDQDSQ